MKHIQKFEEINEGKKEYKEALKNSKYDDIIKRASKFLNIEDLDKKGLGHKQIVKKLIKRIDDINDLIKDYDKHTEECDKWMEKSRKWNKEKEERKRDLLQ